VTEFYVDGKFLPADQAVVPADDLAVLRGYGVFDFLRTYGGKPFFLREHLRRLQRSARQIELECPWSLEALEEIVMETLGRNQLEEANIRIVLSGGSSPDSITPSGKPRLLVMVTPLWQAPQWWRRQGVKVIIVPAARYLPTAKTINYIPAIMALRRAAAQDAIEAVYCDSEGCLQEGTTSNVFVFFGDTLATPSENVLEGITRSIVAEIAGGMFRLEQRKIRKTDLLQASETFLTSSNKEIVPVVRWDEITIGNGKPGERTGRLIQAFGEYTARYAQR
jgi:branched-chain amino acid aminotransferase